MNADDIWAQWKHQPFRPIRLHLADGRAFDVPRRELMLVAKTDIVIGLDCGPDGIPERSALLSPMQVAWIEPIDVEGRKKRPRNPG